MEWKTVNRKDDGTIEVPENWVFLHYYEALNALFRIENALRVFVYVVLKTQFKENWQTINVTSDDAENGSIGKIAKQRMNQAQSFGYLGYVIPCPLMYMTSGELTRLMTSDAYWKHFTPYFLGSKEIIKNKLDEIGSVRNAVAHFRPIKQDDVELIKQNARHVLARIEPCLTDLLRCPNVVPTNTQEDWYKQLKTLGTDHCQLAFQQSEDEKWVTVGCKYKCLVLGQSGGRHLYRYRVSQIDTPAILHEFPEIRGLAVYLAESVSHPSVEKDGLKISKTFTLTFSRNTLVEKSEAIKKQLENLLLCISQETGLLQEDNLARGKIVRAENVFAKWQQKDEDDQGRWSFGCDSMFCAVTESDPPEYWGKIGFVDADYVTSTDNYPWMPIQVTESPTFG